VEQMVRRVCANARRQLCVCGTARVCEALRVGLMKRMTGS